MKLFEAIRELKSGQKLVARCGLEDELMLFGWPHGEIKPKLRGKSVVDWDLDNIVIVDLPKPKVTLRVAVKEITRGCCYTCEWFDGNQKTCIEFAPHFRENTCANGAGHKLLALLEKAGVDLDKEAPCTKE